MFHGLYDIDWESFRRHLGIDNKLEDIPRWIHELLDDDPEKRTWAIECLLGHGQHAGMIGESTPHLIPFMLEVLALDDYPDKAYMLQGFYYVGRYIRSPGTRIRLTRYSLHTYDVLVKGLDIYLRLLNDTDGEIRFYAAKFLRYFQEQYDVVLDALLKRYRVEDELRIRVAIIRSMTNLMVDGYLYYEPENDPYCQLIVDTIHDGADIAERYAAAECIKEMGITYRIKLDEILPRLKQEFDQTYISQYEYDDHDNPRDYDQDRY